MKGLNNRGCTEDTILKMRVYLKLRQGVFRSI